jgi:hypothetical protein
MAVAIVRKSARARDVFERTCASRKFGTAIAAKIAIIATTINNSISVKPERVLRIIPATSLFHWVWRHRVIAEDTLKPPSSFLLSFEALRQPDRIGREGVNPPSHKTRNGIG